MVVWLGFLQPVAAQTNSSSEQDAAWFEQFFARKSKVPIDKAKEDFANETQTAQEMVDPAAQVRAKIKTGLITLTHPDKQVEAKYESSLEYFIKAKAQADTLGLRTEQALIFLSMARVFEAVGNHAKSINLLNQAQSVYPTPDDPLALLVLSELGRVYTLADSMDDAFANYSKLLQLSIATHQKKRQADARFYLGVLFTKKGQYDSAFANFKDALKIQRESHNKVDELNTLNEVGDLCMITKDYTRALNNYKAALEVSQAIQDDDAIARSFNNIGKLYYTQKNYERAVANLELAFPKAQQAQDLAQMEISTTYLSWSYKELSDFKKSLQYREQHLEIRNMIQRERDERKLIEMENNSVIDQKETEIDKLDAKRVAHEKQLAEEKRTRYFLFALIALAIVIAILGFYLYRSKRKSNLILQLANDKITNQNIELQQLNATKDKFFSIISHDLKGPLNSLTSFSGLLINYFDSLSKEEIQTLAKDLDKSLKNLFALLENLLEWSRSQTGAIEFKAEAFDLTEVITQNVDLLTAQAGTKEIKLLYSEAQPITVRAHKNSVNTVIRNLISNAIKFTPKGGTITVTAKPSNEETLISIADTGVGMSAEVINKLFRIDTKHSTKGTADEKGTGLGLVLCKDFIEKNNGSIGVHSEENKGSTFFFTLPTA
jgi:signal transduction histidine kinase